MGSTKLKAMLLCLLCGIAGTIHAQTFEEWFSQKKTQIKYLTLQIAALAQYGAYVKQGYTISKNGLGNIGGYIEGERDLHADYYHSLKNVNPAIKGNTKADSIINYAAQIPTRFDLLNNLTGLDHSYRAYIASVRTKVLDDCNKDLSELQLVITDDKVQMSDDERIKRLDGVYRQMKDKYAFTLYFCGQVRMLLLQREQESKDINTLKQQYGIDQ